MYQLRPIVAVDRGHMDIFKQFFEYRLADFKCSPPRAECAAKVMHEVLALNRLILCLPVPCLALGIMPLHVILWRIGSRLDSDLRYALEIVHLGYRFRYSIRISTWLWFSPL